MEKLRTLLARLITRFDVGPASLRCQAWLWLAGAAEDLNEKRRCLEAALDLYPEDERVWLALAWVQQQAVDDLHPATAEKLATIAQGTGAEVLRGALRYPSGSGGWQLGDVDLSEHLDKYRDREVVMIVAPVGKAKGKPHVCGICGFVMTERGECPRCKLVIGVIIQQLRDRKREREQLFGDIEEFLDEQRGE